MDIHPPRLTALGLRRNFPILARTCRLKPDEVNYCPKIIQDWLFPPTCLLCGDAGAEGRDLCLPCADSLPRNTPACRFCAKPLPFVSLLPCGDCQKRPPAYDRAFALFRYEEPVGYLVRALKFHERYPCARLLGGMLADALQERADKPDLIIPVPLHSGRYRERGYNQALEIGRTLSKRLGIPLDLDSCVRALPTRPQTELTAKERLSNVRRAFVMNRPVTNLHLAILDDVATTGATVNEMAKTLRRAGARRIEVWCCARAVGGHANPMAL